MDGKGRITIPIDIREELELKKDDLFHVVKVGNIITIQKAIIKLDKGDMNK